KSRLCVRKFPRTLCICKLRCVIFISRSRVLNTSTGCVVFLLCSIKKGFENVSWVIASAGFVPWRSIDHWAQRSSCLTFVRDTFLTKQHISILERGRFFLPGGAGLKRSSGSSKEKAEKRGWTGSRYYVSIHV
ncbi:unnamed protein product, partial [Laminaria digitata]